MPTIIVSRMRKASMNSRTRVWIASHAAMMQIGVNSVDSSTNSTLIPSTPMRYPTPYSGSQGTDSTNWKPGFDGSKSNHRISERPNTMRLVQSAVQRALAATVSASPRTHMMTMQPTSGSQVSSESSGKPAAFIASPHQQEDGDQHDHPDQHHEGVGCQRSVLDAHDLARPVGRDLREAVRHAIDDRLVAGVPEELGEALRRPHEQEIVELVEIPLVQQEPVDGGEGLGQPHRQRRVHHVEQVGERDP